MLKVNNSKDLMNILKDVENETIIYDEGFELPKERDKFILSFGNLNVLETIPHMMIEPKWRRKLRMLVLDYHTSIILKGVKKNDK